jgi:hypothetical protein
LRARERYREKERERERKREREIEINYRNVMVIISKDQKGNLYMYKNAAFPCVSGFTHLHGNSILKQKRGGVTVGNCRKLANIFDRSKMCRKKMSLDTTHFNLLPACNVTIV